jgi:hypothetical protein
MRARWGTTATVALAFAAVWSMLVLGLALLAPLYSTTSESSKVEADGTVVSTASVGTDTLVGVNGRGVLLVVCLPLVATAVVALLLRYAERGAAVGGAWLVTLLYLALCVLALLSIGIVLVPVGVALVVACATARRAGRSVDPGVVATA